jgi:transposase InsO family protein
MYDPEDPRRRNPRDQSSVRSGEDEAAGHLNGDVERDEDVDEPVGEVCLEKPSLPLGGRGGRRQRRLVTPEEKTIIRFTPAQRIQLLDIWERSGLDAREIGALTGISRHTLFSWRKLFREQGPAGLMDRPRGALKGSQMPDLTKRTILMMKRQNPEWGCQRISDMLVRGPALFASPGAVARVLKDAGYELEDVPTRPHPDKPRSFERARPNQLWQTDLFTFILKRQNRRVHLVAFLDDHSRFIVGYGLHASASTAMVIEVLLAGIASYGPPEEVLTDNGPQYVTWRGKSAFSKELEKRGVRQIVARPRHPQTLGKIERFWGSLWPECVEKAIFLDLEDARRRIGLYIDYYNFQRPHQGIAGLVPADRFFGAAADVKRTLQARVAANALQLAQHGVPRQPFYVTGQVGGKTFSLHAEGERVILTPAAGGRQEVDLVPPAAQEEPPLPAPVCPHGELASYEAPADTEEMSGPGWSAIDERWDDWNTVSGEQAIESYDEPESLGDTGPSVPDETGGEA